MAQVDAVRVDLDPEAALARGASPATADHGVLAVARELGMPVDPVVGAERPRPCLRSLGALS